MGRASSVVSAGFVEVSFMGSDSSVTPAEIWELRRFQAEWDSWRGGVIL
jgi:hypothetical protein